jgi:integrase
MPRKPSVRYFASRNAYYCQHNGRQHKLASGPDDGPTGPTFLAALEAFKQLLQMGAVTTARDRNTVRVILESYLQHIKGRIQNSTFERRVYSFRPFCARCGEVEVGSLTHFVVRQFLAEMRVPRKGKRRSYAWGDAAESQFLEGANAAFNWAVTTRLISLNPLDGIRPPPARSRSRECLVTPEQHRAILAEARTQTIRNVIIALENTGCRPCELIHATAADWDESLGAIVYYGDDRRRDDEFRHKTAGKAKDRVIYFTGAALEMMRSLIKKHPAGPLFQTTRGGGYGEKSVSNGVRAIRERLGMPTLTPYSYRHTFATNWLKAGKPIEILAEILGNTPNTIRKHYSHLCGDRAAIRRQLEEFKAGPPPGNPPATT